MSSSGATGGPPRNKGKAPAQGPSQGEGSSSGRQRPQRQANGGRQPQPPPPQGPAPRQRFSLRENGSSSRGNGPRRQGNGDVRPQQRGHQHQHQPQGSRQAGASTLPHNMVHVPGPWGSLERAQWQDIIRAQANESWRRHQLAQAQGSRQSGGSSSQRQLGRQIRLLQGHGPDERPDPAWYLTLDRRQQWLRGDLSVLAWERFHDGWQHSGPSGQDIRGLTQQERQDLESWQHHFQGQQRVRRRWVEDKTRRLQGREMMEGGGYSRLLDFSALFRWANEDIMYRDYLLQMALTVAAAAKLPPPPTEEGHSRPAPDQATAPGVTEAGEGAPRQETGAGDQGQGGWSPTPAQVRRFSAATDWDAMVEHSLSAAENCICKMCTFPETLPPPELECPCARCEGLNKDGMPCRDGWGRMLSLFAQQHGQKRMLEVSMDEIFGCYYQGR